mmetsp:Transcript_16110/g.32617  ORF Transcript_16110/g.32617 Transcript_16110/m.32617 type:complete len:466 (-) Transcript_16110:304-1701(-)
MARAQGHAEGGGTADLDEVEVRVGALDVHRGVHRDARLPPGPRELDDLAPVVLAPVEDMVPENRGDARVRQDVGVADEHLVVRERPVALGAPGVVVVDEGHGVRRHPSDHARRLPVAVAEAPILAVPYSFLQHAFRGEVKGGALLVRAVDPIHGVLPVLVLVVAEAVVVVSHVTPQLADGPGRRALLAVVPDEVRRVALHEVEAPGIKSDLELQPAHPDTDALLHSLVPVVDVWRGVELAVELTRVVLARPVGEIVPEGDGPAAPVHDPRKARAVLDARRGELVPAPLAVLLVAAAVVDDDIRHGADVVFMQGLDQSLERLPIAVFRTVEVEELGGQVALRGHGLRGRGQPNVRHAQGLHDADVLLDDAVPVAPAGAPRLPIEALQQHDIAQVGCGDDLFHVRQEAPAGHSTLHLVELFALKRINLRLVGLAIGLQVLDLDEHQARCPAHFGVEHTVVPNAEVAA